METAAMKNFQSIVCTILFLLLISPLSADPTKVVDLKFPPKIEAGQQYSASVVLDAPAPAGGSKVILLPTHRIEYQDTLIVPEGKTEAEFTFDVFKDQIRDWHFEKGITVTTMFKGNTKDWAGPKVE